MKITRERCTLCAAAILLGVLVTGCAGNPAAPSTPAQATASTPTSSLDAHAWNVRIETTAVTPQSFCVFVPPPGSVYVGTYSLAFGSGTVAFSPSDPIDWDTYTVKESGSSFTGTNAPVHSGAGMCEPYVEQSSITGSFSPDYMSFTAMETVAYTLASGDVKSVTFSWTGTRTI